MITVAIAETAVESDSQALAKVVDHYEEHGQQPDTLYADTAYGSDENYEMCHRGRSYQKLDDTLKKKKGHRDQAVIRLVSPPRGQTAREKEAEQLGQGEGPLTIVDFKFDSSDNRFTHCPAGKRLHRAHNTGDQHDLMMLDPTCKGCPLLSRCPIKRDRYGMLAKLKISGKDYRLAKRRKEQQTDSFKRDYKIRSGIESTNSSLKRVTGLGQLRVRGRAAVFTSILLKVAGWNLLQAARQWLSLALCDCLALFKWVFANRIGISLSTR